MGWSGAAGKRAGSTLGRSTAARYSDSWSVVCVEGGPACPDPRGKIWLICSLISMVCPFWPNPLVSPDFSELPSAASSLISSVMELSILKWLWEVRLYPGWLPSSCAG